MIDRLMIVDYVVIGLIVLSMLIGIWRGFLREAMSLLSWAAAFFIAYTFVESAAAFLQPYIPVPSVRTILGFGGLFVATLMVGGLVNLLIGQLVRATGLGGTDRMIGVLFGFVRGVAIVAVLLLAISLTPVPDDPWWQTSVLVPYFEPMVQWLRTMMPDNVMSFLAIPEVGADASAAPEAPPAN